MGYSAYLLQDPAVLAAEVLRGAGVGQPGPGPRGPAEQVVYGSTATTGTTGTAGRAEADAPASAQVTARVGAGMVESGPLWIYFR